MSLLELQDIKKIFKVKNNTIETLKGINLKIEKGDFLAIVGTSGSGKTTLLNILGLLDEKSAGNYLLCGNDVGNLKEKELAKMRNAFFGFVVQDFALINDYSVKDNIKMPFEYSRKRISKADIDLKIKEICSRLGIDNKLKQPVKNLSGGEKQRVAIARALVNDPQIILADEPTGSLDKKTTAEILEIFKELKDMGKTLILITHDEKVAAITNKILQLEDGHIIDEQIWFQEK